MHLLDVFGGKFEPSAVGNSLSGDRVAWPLWIDAGDPESLASGAELASEVRRGQSEVLCQELEPVFFEIECGAVGSGNADAEHGLEEEAGIRAAPSGALDDQAVVLSDLLADFEHAGLDLFACRWRQTGYEPALRHLPFLT
ncbi:hypothetical protein [Mesorhizobium sp. L-8-10]|uniref:hypothetical protein n=1 Tax=Mesorhizobium sp. L-8-10 TaxID=2744523 RepID=UPI001925E288|nr:hypothetical protein [Mesorhizobium sp. L-8-10]